MATATRIVTYNDQETALTGFLAWDDAAPQPPALDVLDTTCLA
jgi:hypothetical protein